GSDLAVASDFKSAVFTGHSAGSAAIRATDGTRTGTTGTLTVVSGTAAAITIETAANGSGTILTARNVASGTSVTGFAIQRDASNNFIANVAATWSLNSITGGVVNGDLVPAGDSM